ncbi:Adenosylcobinamide-phosphate guanylyltransferase [Chitinispirillum alkaliphilum]|nr:Adenosylcobinamide-phosphate guanylyltransferase [Chitinispirillum alkaliphilum]
MGKIVLITGGVRSGKSAWALERANASSYSQKIFIATAECFDDEMNERVVNHQKERGEKWQTIEETIDLVKAISEIHDNTVAVIDCCTVWLGNVWHKLGDSDQVLQDYIDSFCNALQKWNDGEENGEVIIVSNEVGWGIVPLEKSVRRYRDWAGKLNQRIASIADEVYLSVAGIGVRIKGGE